MGDPSGRLSRYDHGDSDSHDDDTFDDFVMMKAITLIMIKTQQSIGLAFVAYPEATLTMDLPPLW